MKNPEKFWDRISKNYDNSSKKVSNEPSRPLLATQKYLNINDSVLDYGCATGKASIEISEFVHNVYGIDISAKMIGIAEKKAETNEIKNVTFAQMEIFSEQLQPESFSVVVAYNVLHLLNTVDEAIQRIYNLLKPGGFFISNTPCLGEHKYFWGSIIYIGGKLNLMPDVKTFKGEDVVAILTKNKFDIIENKKLAESAMNYFIVAKKS